MVFTSGRIGLFGKILIPALSVVWCLMPVYAASKFPDYPVRQATNCVASVKKADIAIGVQPIEARKDQEIYFGMEFAPKGFLPVFVVIQNASNSDSFLFDKTSITYGQVDSSPLATPEVRPAGLGKVGVGGLLSLLFPGLDVTQAAEIQQNILKQALQSKTLSPGTSVHGILYVPAPGASDRRNKTILRQKIYLRIPLVKASSGESSVIDVMF